MPITQADLQDVMKFHLKNFAATGVTVDDNTIHNTILSTQDGWKGANSSDVYKAVVRWTLAKTNSGNPTWPSKWLTLSVQDLASKLTS